MTKRDLLTTIIAISVGVTAVMVFTFAFADTWDRFKPEKPITQADDSDFESRSLIHAGTPGTPPASPALPSNAGSSSTQSAPAPAAKTPSADSSDLRVQTVSSPLQNKASDIEHSVDGIVDQAGNGLHGGVAVARGLTAHGRPDALIAARKLADNAAGTGKDNANGRNRD